MRIFFYLQNEISLRVLWELFGVVVLWKKFEMIKIAPKNFTSKFFVFFRGISEYFYWRFFNFCRRYTIIY